MKLLLSKTALAFAALLTAFALHAVDLPTPAVRLDFSDGDLSNSGSAAISTPALPSGFSVTTCSDVLNRKQTALKTSGSAIASIEVGSLNLNATDGCTISFWAALPADANTDALGLDWIKDPATSTTRICQNFQNYYYGLLFTTANSGDSCLDIGAVQNVSTTKMEHWLVTLSGTRMTLYRNGASVGNNRNYPSPATMGLAAIGLGGSAKRGGGYGAAYLADVRVYNAVLSQEQITALAQGTDTSSGYTATVAGELNFSEISWNDGATYANDAKSTASLTLFNGTVLTLDTPLVLSTLSLSVPNGSAVVRGEAADLLAGVSEVAVSGHVDLGALGIPELTVAANGTVVVEDATQIGSLSLGEGALLRLAGGETLQQLTPDAIVGVGQTLAVSKTVEVENLRLTGRNLRIEEGADISVSNMFRTADAAPEPYYSSASVTQTGGTLTCAATTVTANGAEYKIGPFVLSHWPQTTHYSLSGGTLNVPNAQAKLGADGTGNLTISGTGVANLHSVSIRRGTLTLSTGGTLNLGAAEVENVLSRDWGSFALAGGTLGTFESTRITLASLLSVTADTTIRTTTAVGGVPAEVAFTGTLSGSGALTATGSGTLDLSQATTSSLTGVTTAEGTLKLGTNRDVYLGDLGEATVVDVTTTSAEQASGRVSLQVVFEETPSADHFVVCNENGVPVSNLRVANNGKTLTLAFDSEIVVVEESGDWSSLLEGLTENDSTIQIRGGATADDALTLVLDVAVPETVHAIQIAGHVIIVPTEEQSVLPAGLALQEGAVLTIQGDLSEAMTIPEGATLVVEETDVTKALTVRGTLQTLGVVNLTSSSNTVRSTGTLEVLFGEATLKCGNSSLVGHIVVGEEATLRCGVRDALAYSGTVPTVDVSGTLELTGTTRWLFASGTTLRLHDGAVLKGKGGYDGYDYAYDFLLGGTLRSEGNASIEGNLGAQSGGAIALDVQSGVLALSGKISNDGGASVVKRGAGELRLSGASSLDEPFAVQAGILTLAGGCSLPAACAVQVTGGAVQMDSSEADLSLVCPISLADGTRLDCIGSEAHVSTYGGDLSGTGALNVLSGTLRLTSACSRLSSPSSYAASAPTRIAEGATLDLSAEGARLYSNSFGGASEVATLTIQGTLVINDWVYDGRLGKLRTNVYSTVLDGGTVRFTGDVAAIGTRGVTLTANGGTLEIPEGSALAIPANANAYVSLPADATLAVTGGALALLQSQTLRGSLAVRNARLTLAAQLLGTLDLGEGASLDVSQTGAVFADALVLPATARSVRLLVSGDAADGDALLSLSGEGDAPNVSALVACDAEGKPLSSASLELSGDGTALRLRLQGSETEVPPTGGSDGEALTEEAQATLREIMEATGHTTVNAIEGSANGAALTAAQISEAVALFDGDGLCRFETDGDGQTVLTVGYVFAVTGIDRDGNQVAVTVSVTDLEGAALRYADGVVVSLVTLDGAEVVSPVTPTADDGTVTVTIAVPEGTTLFKAKAEKAQ